MYILGIDTSCDDTCVSVVKAEKGKFKILSNIVSSQVKIHQKYGGVYPFLAKREHQQNLPIVFNEALKKAGIDISKIKLIGLTVCPGLEPCLWAGVNFATEIAQKNDISIVPVNHLEAHILANWLTSSFPSTSHLFPAVCLVVSGGHTNLFLMKGVGKFKLLGKTRDDAAGECLDKTGRLLGLNYPAGPAISQLAAKWKAKNKVKKIILPRPMMYQKNYDFSFAGLKTAVLYLLKNLDAAKHKEELCFEIQQAVIDVLIFKTLKAVKEFGAKTIILGGGVAANDELRRQLKMVSAKAKVNFLTPPLKLCTDNAAMIAATAFFHRNKKGEWKKIKVSANI